MEITASRFASRMLTLAALFAAMLAFTAMAHAEGRAHKGKTGHLKITTPTAVGDTVLEPGDYNVREVRSSDGPMVEFVRVTVDLFAPDGSPSYDEEVVARVQSTEETLSAPPKQTRLELEPQTASASALMIRGEAVEYRFAPSQASGEAGAMAGPTENRDYDAGQK